jgi:tetratricopeptide (TPR) repeat protein
MTQASWAISLKPSNEKMLIIIESANFVFADSFNAAFKIAETLNDTLPGKPLYHLLYASILHAQMMDGEDFDREKDFAQNIDASIKALNDWNDHNPDDAWSRFFLGSAYGYKAVWQAQKGSWFKAMLSGLKAKGNFSDALKIDSRLYDCYTGLGSYHYWSSIKLRKIFPFLSDNRQTGLNELRLAMDSSIISQKAASTGYSWALLNEKKYSDALKVAYQLRETTNGGRNSLWLLSAIYWSNSNLKKAAENYGLLVESLERAGNQNFYNMIYCRYRKGVCCYGLENYVKASDEFQKLLSYNPPPKIRDRQEKTFLKAKDYLNKIKIRIDKQTKTSN